MRLLAYILFGFGLIYLADAAYDENRGVADVVSPTGYGHRFAVKRAEDPEQFRNLMAYQGVRGTLFLMGGFISLGICRRADRCDPFSPDFAGKPALDDLNRSLTEEDEKRHRPLK